MYIMNEGFQRAAMGYRRDTANRMYESDNNGILKEFDAWMKFSGRTFLRGYCGVMQNEKNGKYGKFEISIYDCDQPRVPVSYSSKGFSGDIKWNGEQYKFCLNDTGITINGDVYPIRLSYYGLEVSYTLDVGANYDEYPDIFFSMNAIVLPRAGMNSIGKIPPLWHIQNYL